MPTECYFGQQWRCIVYTPLRWIDENDNIIQEPLCDNKVEVMKNSLSTLLAKDLLGTYFSVIIRKHDFLAVGGCYEKLPARQDWDLWIRLAERGEIVKDSRTAISYRIHSNQISHAGEKNSLDICVFWKSILLRIISILEQKLLTMKTC